MMQFDGVLKMYDAGGMANHGQRGVSAFRRLGTGVFETQPIPMERTFLFAVENGVFEFEIVVL